MVGDLPSVPLLEAVAPDATSARLPSCAALEDGDRVLLWEPGSDKACTLLRAVRDPRSIRGSCILRFPPAAGHVPPEGLARILPPGGYAAGTRVMRPGQREEPFKFSIDRRPREPGLAPRLVRWRRSDRRDLEVVAEGVEEMHLAWACDENGDGLFTEGDTEAGKRGDEWGNNVQGDVAPACLSPPGCRGSGCARVPIGMVRISLRAWLPPGSPPEAQGARREWRGSRSATEGGRLLLTGTVRPQNLFR
jgi:hypothetical protein